MSVSIVSDDRGHAATTMAIATAIRQIAQTRNTLKRRKYVFLSCLPRVPSPAPTKRQNLLSEINPSVLRRRRHNALHKRRRTRAARSTHPPADLVTGPLVTMAGLASNAAGNAAGRYNLRPRGRRSKMELRGSAALADSPLLGRLLGELAAVFDFEVLPLLDPTTRALLGRVGQTCRDAVLRSPKLPCAGRTVGVKFKVREFVVSVQLLAWAQANGCPWEARVCTLAARGGHLEVLKWARDHQCPWEADTCSFAAEEGHLAVLKWSRAHGCEWDADTCMYAALGGQLAVLRWARAHHCEWDAENVVRAPLRAGTWRCCGGRGSTTARGTGRRVQPPLGTGNWRC